MKRTHANSNKPPRKFIKLSEISFFKSVFAAWFYLGLMLLCAYILIQLDYVLLSAIPLAALTFFSIRWGANYWKYWFHGLKTWEAICVDFKVLRIFLIISIFRDIIREGRSGIEFKRTVMTLTITIVTFIALVVYFRYIA